MARTGRRRFLATLASAGVTPLLGKLTKAAEAAAPAGPGSGKPVAVSTWKRGITALRVAAPMLAAGASALDAGEKGINAVELDPEDTGVGLGGLPNEEGVVELDAAVMTGTPHRYGAVASLRGIATPCSVARKVMENTRHCLLVGEGARRFARDVGFEEHEGLTPKARKAWLKWRAERGGDDNWLPPSENHDTIGYLGLDAKGQLAAVVSTSGLAWKIPGRVGDSPIVGAGLFVDEEVGAACATGLGEEVLRTAGSAMVVEAMRHGATPQQAVEDALRRILKKSPSAARDTTVQVCYLAVNRRGEIGAAALSPASPFDYAVWRSGMESPVLTVGPVVRR